MGLFKKKVLHITCATVSEVGKKAHNEDYVMTSVEGVQGCFVLADGLGGHGYGEVASKLVCENAMNIYSRKFEDVEVFLKDAFETGQYKLLEAQKSKNQFNDMKTTLVVAVADETNLQWAHIGDSRLYLFEKNKIKIRTIDHSLPQMLVYAKEITEEDIRFHPDRNRLLRVMGIPWSSENFEISKKYALKDNYSFLICSDGFWEYITEKEMCETLKKANSVEEWLASMKEIVEINGKDKDMDNYSAIGGWIR